MKLVAHVIYRLDIGGLENGLVNLINRMPDDRYRHAILCLNGYTDFSSRIGKHVELIDIGKKEGQDMGMHLRLWKAFMKLKPDIVHTRNLAALEAAVPAWLAGVKIRIHGEHGRDVNDLDGKNRKYRFVRRLYSPFITRYIALSRDLECYLERDIGIRRSRIAQIYNGVDSSKFHPSASQGEQFVIGTVGRMQAVKDQITLARAFVRMLEIAPQYRAKARLLMVGDGPLKIEAMKILEASGFGELAEFPGSSNDVPEMMGKMDLFVLPSLAEGISNTILEAMSCGLPIIATDVGGNPELVENGKTGLIVPPADPERMALSMLTYLSDQDLAIRHGKASRERIEMHFSMEAMVRNYMHVYDDCLTGKTTCAE